MGFLTPPAVSGGFLDETLVKGSVGSMRGDYTPKEG